MPLSNSAALRKDRRTTDSAIKLTHRHFALIARTIAEARRVEAYTGVRQDYAAHFAFALQHTNPRFDRARFLTACRGE